MTQAASAVSTVTTATNPALAGDDIALAIAARVTAKRNLESALANHQAIVTKMQGQHTAIQAEIDGAKSAYESGSTWTEPANSVLIQLQPVSAAQRQIPPRGPIPARNAAAPANPATAQPQPSGTIAANSPAASPATIK